MFSSSKDDIRAAYSNAWLKHKKQQSLSALERQLVAVIELHPEYHLLLEQPDSEAFSDEYAPEASANPFLHMGLHLALQEQIATNRPAGIRDVYTALCRKHRAHDIEHKMMMCLQQELAAAQREQRLPDEYSYLNCLKTL